MNTDWKDWLGKYYIVWNHFCVFPEDKTARSHQLPPEARMLTPLVGTGIGLGLAVFVFLLQAMLPSLLCGILGGILIPLILEKLTGWSGILSVTAFFQSREQGNSWIESSQLEELQPGTQPDDFAAAGIRPILYLISLWLLRAFLFGMISAHGSAACLIAILTAGYLMRAELCGLRSAQTGRSFFPNPQTLRNRYWITGGIAVLLSLLPHGNLIAAIPLLAAAWGLAAAVKTLLKASGGSINRTQLDLFGFFTDTLLLLLTILILH